MRPGDRATVAGYEFTFTGVAEQRGPNYMAMSGGFVVRKEDVPVAVLYPERRRYVATGTETTEAAIESGFLADLYAVLGEGNGMDGWTVRLYPKPLVPWLWMGALIMVGGGRASLRARRLRAGAPAGRHPPPS